MGLNKKALCLYLTLLFYFGKPKILKTINIIAFFNNNTPGILS